jgi:hypothetical protein
VRVERGIQVDHVTVYRWVQRSTPRLTEAARFVPVFPVIDCSSTNLRQGDGVWRRPGIAGELSVSPNTVNTHLRSIYAKLQVRDRSSAVLRARELRLLAAGRMR